MAKIKVPRWIKETDDCIWCNREQMEVVKITPVKKKFEEGLKVSYACGYERCEYKRRYGKKHISTMIYSGKGYVTMYDKFIEELKKKPAPPKEEKPVENGC